jgi:hypothetical protein
MHPMQFRLICLGLGLATVGTLGAMAHAPVHAQATAVTTEQRARQQYDFDIAVCNMAGFTAPDRDTCVREAGVRLDRLRGVPAGTEGTISTDGRATVMTASPGQAPRGSTTTTSSDGRATVVVPEVAPAR